MKTKEELNALKEEVEMMNKKLHELTEEELAQVPGGVLPVPSEPDLELPGGVLPVSTKHDLELPDGVLPISTKHDLELPDVELPGFEIDDPGSDGLRWVSVPLYKKSGI